MSGSLKEFVTQRLEMLLAEQRQLEARLREIAEEKEQLRKAVEVLGEDYGALSSAASLRTTSPKRIPGMTLKDAAIEALSKEADGLAATDILLAINEKYDVAIERSSLSPQLSRLKQEGRIERKNGKWRIPPGANVFQHEGKENTEV